MLISGAMTSSCLCYAQTDTTYPQTIDSFILRQKGLIGNLARNLLVHPEDSIPKKLHRNDEAFQPFRGLVIRHIIIRSLNLTVNFSDTSKRFTDKFTRLLNHLHRNTREAVIRKNIFFSEGTRLSPYLLGVNERHLRDQSYLQDAKIKVQPVLVDKDSVDVIVFSKDAFSLGSELNIHEINKAEAKIKEENFMGLGDRWQASVLYDQKRHTPMAYGGEYAARNINGSFIDGYIGYHNYSRSLTDGKPEEAQTYLKLIKPLLNPFMKWTYAFEISRHTSANMYFPDSVYKTSYQYQYNVTDAWAGWNFIADKLTSPGKEDRVNWLLSGRLLRRHFMDRPMFTGKNYYRFNNFEALLGAISFYKQDFYKTAFIYGFGRAEDVPEGMDASLTSGWTKTQNRERPYLGLDLQRYFFTRAENYFNYTLKMGAYFYKGTMEDVNLLAGVDYFSRLHYLNTRWKQRGFLSASISRQINQLLNAPLLLESSYGLPHYQNNEIPGLSRITLKAESVFFSPWTVLYFHLAPFVFGSGTLFNYDMDTTRTSSLYSSLGGGLRIQNQSLVFGTIELKGAFYPRPDFKNRSWRLEIGTNMRFRYNKVFIKRPELVDIN